ncbi:SDR family oxidoreductase [Roseibium sp. HPY-6]|uniref:SDR family oxidoreductase n=1 Tax=Roseibium sp. HPY-6 TaxID=3229852 RepID=UPI0033905AF1
MNADRPEEMMATQPMTRFGEPEEVARMGQFLMCEATYSTGSEFLVDGGMVTGQRAIAKAN